MTDRLMVDSDDIDAIPESMLESIAIIGYYVDGEPGSATSEQLQRFASKGHNTITRKRGVSAKTCDVESGTMTPEDAAFNLSNGLSDTVYTNFDNVTDTNTRIRNAGYHGPINWWTGHWDQTSADPGAAATQIKSPTSNPPSAGHWDESIVVDDNWLANKPMPPVTEEGEMTTVPPMPPDNEELKDSTGHEMDAPVVAALSLNNGTGYYLVAADGGVFCFGEAWYWGSYPDLMAGNQYTADPTTGRPVKKLMEEKAPPLVQPIVAVVGHGDNRGYGLVAADGGVFAFGNYAYQGGA